MTTATADNAAVALAVRRVNAEWSRAGEPAVPALRPLWLTLTNELHLAEVEGDGAAPRTGFGSALGPLLRDALKAPSPGLPDAET